MRARLRGDGDPHRARALLRWLEQNQVENSERFVPPSPLVGGWTKFIKTSVYLKVPEVHKRALLYVEPERIRQQPKKSGRGWLHK